MGRVITAQAVAPAGQFVPAREPGPNKGPRRSETAQAVASAGKFVPAREPGSSKGPRRLESAPAASLAVRVVHARSTRVEQRLEACEEGTSCINGGTSSARQEHSSCTSCNIGGTGSVRQKHRPSLTDSGCVSTKYVQRVQQLTLHVHR